MKLTPKRRELIAAVRAYAAENYTNGWDVIVECYDDEEIAEVIGRARTVKGALAKLTPIIDVVADRRAEADYQIREAVGSDGLHAWRVEDFEAGDLIQVVKNGPKIYVTGTTAEAVTVDDVNGAPRRYPTWRVVTRQRGGRKGETLTRRPVEVPRKSVYGGSYTRYDKSGSTTRWHGKVGAEFEDEHGRFYSPGWRGAIILTADYCNHRPSTGYPGTAEGFWPCNGDHCNFAAHPECEPPF